MLNMTGLTRAAAAFAVAGLVAGGFAAPARAAPPHRPADRAARTVDPGALDALTRMSAHLATLKTFEFTAQTTMEAVLRKGHQVEIGGTVHYWVKRPDRVRIDSETDAVSRQYFFDGDSFTLVAPAQGYYARTKGKATIRDTLAFAAQTLNVELPLADLFEWGTPESPITQFQRGFYVGTAKVGGVTTDHYALSGRDFDFEVWIQQGDKPLPLKMALVDRKAPGSPRFSAVLSWTPDAQFSDDVFTFKPADGLVRIEFAKPGPFAKRGPFAKPGPFANPAAPATPAEGEKPAAAPAATEKGAK